jgi:endonuclease-8
MPEGDVVWRTARRLDRALAGRRLTRSELRWPSLATVDLTGRTVQEVVSAGKHILTRLSGEDRHPALTLHSHLKMEGSWRVHRTKRQDPPAAFRHDVRAVLANTEWTAVGHRLGRLDVVRTGEEATLIGHLGPDVLGPGWDPAAAARNLAAEPGRAVGEALLDQRVLAGVGTFYMAECLFVRRVTPWTPVRDAGDAIDLVRLVHRMLDANRERPPSTTGNTRSGETQWVHGRSGRPCRRCGTIVRVAPLGEAPRQRTAFYCPSCQRGPTPTDDKRRQRPLGASLPGRR